MLAYRLIKKDVFLRIDERDAYLNEYLIEDDRKHCELPSFFNTFDYSIYSNRYHFFTFAEDAYKYFLFTMKYYYGDNLCPGVKEDYFKIAEYEIDNELIVKYSGFGTYQKKEFSHPTLEISIPVIDAHYQDNIKGYENKKYRYFKLDGVNNTGSMYSYNDPQLLKKYRNELYKKYCQELWKEFIETYQVKYDSNEMTFDNRNRPYENEINGARRKILSKYNLI